MLTVVSPSLILLKSVLISVIVLNVVAPEEEAEEIEFFLFFSVAATAYPMIR
jgi:hypothetical protein